MKLEELLERLPIVHPPMKLQPDKTALILIDMQRLALSEFLVHNAVAVGVPEAEAREAVAEMDERFRKTILNAQRVLHACREKGIRPIHVRIESYAADGADVGRLHRLANFIVPPGSPWGEFIPEVQPLPGEIVLPKTNSSAFTGTMLNQVLRNMGIDEVIIVGFRTDQCVTTAAREAADLGYETMVVVDGVMALTQENHEHALRHIVDVYVQGCTADELVQRIRS